MPSLFRDRVYEQTSSKGTGTITLLGAPLGYQSFSVFGDGNQAYYVIAQNQANQWEVGKGTVHITAGVVTLARTTVLRSSNADAAVDFNVTGKMEVRCPLPADLMDYLVDPATLIHKDGSVTFTGDQSLGGHELTNVGKLNKITFTQPATGATFTPADNSSLITSGANAVTITSTGTTNVTLPSGTRMLVARDTTDTLTNKTLTSPVLNQPTINGSGGALTLPAGPDTFVGRATTDTLTNKTLTSPVLNQPTINGSGGALTLPAGPTTLVGRDTTDTLTNKSIDAGQLTGTIVAGRMPALTGDVTTTAGAVATTISAGAVTLSKQAALAANSLIGNPTGSSATPAAVGWTSNFKITSSQLDTAQGIQTTSTPQFASLGVAGAAQSNGFALEVTPITDTNGLFIKRRASGANAGSSWGILVQNPGATDAFYLCQNNSAGAGPLAWIGANDAFCYYPNGRFVWGNSHPTITMSSGNNVQLGGDATSSTLAGATADIESMASVDRINTRHAAAGNRMLGLQSERGSAMYIGDDAIDFAAATGIVSVNGTDLLTMTSTGLSVLSRKVGGTLKTIVSSAPNGTTVETDLHSATIVANTMNDGDSLEIWQDFQIANNANNKTIKLYVNGTQIMTSGAAAVAGQAAQIITTIKRVSSTSTIITTQFIPMTGSAWSRNDVLSDQNINWTGSIVIKATGQSSAASNDVVQRSTVILYNPANP